LDDSHRHSTATESPGLLARADETSVRIRPLTSLPDYQACVALQIEVWGSEYDDTIPATLLQVATHIGGVAAGAFNPNGELLGFVFGLTGVKDGEVLHWSHALGVRETSRNGGVGRMLKEHQRTELARRGIANMYWTFDPLIAKNAHLNLNRLGARVVEYVPDMYGTTRSPLHHGLATDRLVVVCATGPRPPARFATSPLTDRVPLLTRATQAGDIIAAGNGEYPPTVSIEVPTDIEQVIAESPPTAAEWHASIRRHFRWALGSGYTVTGLRRDPIASRSFYTLELHPKLA